MTAVDAWIETKGNAPDKFTGGVLVPDAGAEGRPRSADTAIFSRVLYQLSYLGSVVGTSVEECPTVGETGLEPVTFRV